MLMAKRSKTTRLQLGKSIGTHLEQRPAEHKPVLPSEPTVKSMGTLDAGSLAALRSLFALLDQWDRRENVHED
jgi:hypothetical protein